MQWTRSARLAAVALLCGLPSADAGRPAALSWSRRPGAEACVGAAELARAVEARIGHPALVAPSRAELSIEGQVGRREGGGWRAVLVVARPGGEIMTQRTLDTRQPDCRTLDPALTLVIALLVDPEGAPSPPASTPEVIVREVYVPIVVVRPWRLSASSDVELEAGVLPSAALASSLGILVGPPGLLPLSLTGFLYAGQDGATSLDGRSAHLRLAGLGAAVCPGATVGPARVLACGGARLGWLRWAGQGFEVNDSGSLLVPSASLDARLELPLVGRLGAFAAVGARAPLRRVRLTYERSTAVAGPTGDPTTVIYEASVVSLWLGFGVAVRFF